jgi:hypothetical protein
MLYNSFNLLLILITYINYISYSLGKMGSNTKPFNIYKGSNSNLEIKPQATKADLLLMRIKRANLLIYIKTRADSKRSSLQVREEIKSEYKVYLKRKLK